MDLETFRLRFEEFGWFRRGAGLETKRRELAAAIRRQLPATADDKQWLAEALADNQRKWFVLFVVKVWGSVPKALYGAMIRAAVYEVDPSVNRYFVEPCLHSYGNRRVVESLLKYAETGSDFEKAGAANALYWAGLPSRYPGADKDEIADLSLRRRCLYLREFAANESVDVRRSIIPSLKLEDAAYPEELRPLVAEAIRIARSHPDDYIRQRVEVQLGTQAVIPPLPHRES